MVAMARAAERQSHTPAITSRSSPSPKYAARKSTKTEADESSMAAATEATTARSCG